MTSSFIQGDPTSEPISLTEAKDHLRVDGTEQDVLIQLMLVAARQRCEVETRTVIGDCTCQMVLDRFPNCGEPVRFSRGGIKSVTSIIYIDANNVTQTLATDTYRVDMAGGRIIPLASWPATGTRYSSVTISMTAGSAPACVKHAMLLILGALFENREDMSDVQTFRIPLNASYLLAPAVYGSYP